MPDEEQYDGEEQEQPVVAEYEPPGIGELGTIGGVAFAATGDEIGSATTTIKGK